MAKSTDPLRRLGSERVLWAAWSHVARGTGMPGTDGVTPSSYGRKLTQNLAELGRLLRSGDYRSQPLRPTVTRRGGRARHLAIPTVRDRIAQRAFLEVFGHRLDAGAAEVSFAYRRGRSWLDALTRVERHRDAGLRHVVRGDIADFFDRIDHARLEAELVEVVGATVGALAMQWVRTPLLTGNGLVARPCGIPQGAPVSPVLANTFLRGFDQAVDHPTRRLVRYADEFVVCCPDAAQASLAHLLVRTELGDRRLELHAAKSAVTSFDEGFTFLGWHFLGEDGYEDDPSGEWAHPWTRRARGRSPLQPVSAAAVAESPDRADPPSPGRVMFRRADAASTTLFRRARRA